MVDEYDERMTYLGTGIGNLDAAKRYLKAKFRQQPAEIPISRPGARFYVSVRNAGRTGFLLGPYASYIATSGQVERGRQLAEAADSWAGFYSYGIASYPKSVSTVFGR